MSNNSNNEPENEKMEELAEMIADTMVETDSTLGETLSAFEEAKNDYQASEKEDQGYVRSPYQD